ncbi:hypothetical protein MOK15_21380 [Sphingobium sp. BYY-5]|uniref:hypothetical protein n=1 Tax=Sphingobium sp. BYY-5 TaxID=2926400 RepID=UPI001FA76CEB|nr:hypothetical protein [Sphingobium sp. BYY-5]MCI4592612.1 hypothetical protein [Sphingobium sp. BYY-5]
MTSGSAARRELAQAAAMSGWPCTRGARYRAGVRPGFAALQAMPRWVVLDAQAQEKIAMVALLIGAQSALSRLIDGATLRGYALLVGAPVLERIWMLEDGGRDPLPAVDALPSAANRLLAAAAQESEARQRMAQAERMLREMGAWPSI